MWVTFITSVVAAARHTQCAASDDTPTAEVSVALVCYGMRTMNHLVTATTIDTLPQDRTIDIDDDDYAAVHDDDDDHQIHDACC
jgi:hypothetical protein